ncbi:hypothetical protein PO124_00055 [Bacillus licheniformis]|nr:hypothetical protein [Bacillus licheniformis]
MKEYEGQVVEVLVEGESKTTLISLPAIHGKQACQLQRTKRSDRPACQREIHQAKTWSLDGEMVGEAIEVK